MDERATMATVRKPTELTPGQRQAVHRAAAQLEADHGKAGARFARMLQRLVDDGASMAAIARELGVSRQAIHERLQKRGEEPEERKR
jgi:DNA-binding phage protein